MYFKKSESFVAMLKGWFLLLGNKRGCVALE